MTFEQTTWRAPRVVRLSAASASQAGVNNGTYESVACTCEFSISDNDSLAPSA
jgi:hypothetical protein